MNRFSDAILNALYPSVCRLCSASAEASLCSGCAAQLVPLEFGTCIRCGLGSTGACRDCRWMSALDYLRSPVQYAGVGGWAVRELKFRRAIPIAERMASVMRSLLDQLPPYDAAVPIPIHWSREAGRGFNQSLLIANQLGLWPVRPELLTRVKRTRPQAQLSAKQRAKNLSDAFRAGRVAHMRILLVDDVVTSGATLEACAQELKHAGASWVGAVTFARELADAN